MSILLLAQASKSRRLTETALLQHLRPSLVLDGGIEPYAEDHWESLQVGERQMSIQSFIDLKVRRAGQRRS